MEAQTFAWQDYLVLFLVLLMSAAIGFYYACSGGKQKTTKEYLLADRNMHWFPVACSLLASFVSSQTLIGTPGEVYTFGTMLVYGSLLLPLAILCATYVYIPFLKGLKIISVYEYVGMRFGKLLKLLLTFSGILNLMIYAALVIYGPALSVSAVSGINLWLAVLSVSLVGIIYTVLGGMKAVLWTDTLQLMIMLSGIFTVIIYGSLSGGGFTEVWEMNKLSGRLDMLEPSKFGDFDPRARHTIWSTSFGLFMLYVGVYGYGQVSLLRAMTLKTRRDTKLAYGVTAIGTVVFGLSCQWIGLAMFSYFKHCDPVSNGEIFSKDQIYPLYVLRLFGHMPGLPGFILSAVFSASLSTVSSLLNSVAAIVLQDVVRPCKPDISDKHATIVSKVLSLASGCVAMALVVFARYVGVGILSTGNTIAGAFSGPTFAIFTLGMTSPAINSRGATVGFVIGLAYGLLMALGGLLNPAYVYNYPVSTAGCNITDPQMLGNLTSPMYDPQTWNPQSHYRSGLSAIFDVSYLWTGPGGCIVTAIFSAIFSLIFSTKCEEKVEEKLLLPVVTRSACCMPASWKNKIIFSGRELDQGHDNTEFAHSRSSSSCDVMKTVELQNTKM